MVDGLNEVVSELRRIGNNINQLTYLANSGRIYAVDLSEVKQEIGKVWNVINNLRIIAQIKMKLIEKYINVVLQQV